MRIAYVREALARRLWMGIAMLVVCTGQMAWSMEARVPSLEPGRPSIEDYATIESTCHGVPVYSFSNLTYVYGVSPDFLPGVLMQKDNTHPVQKIKPKKSWEIKHNLVGANHEMTPKTPWNDSQPYLPVHLIDGDPDTVWCSWGCRVPDGRPEWIRIDLPTERTVNAVALVCSRSFPRETTAGNYGRALPEEIEIKLSRDAWHWESVYQSSGFTGDATGTTIIEFNARPARQIWITANHFPLEELTSKHIFSIGEVEVRDPSGENVALLSRGAIVMVSSKSSSHENDRIAQAALWAPLQFDLGIKWVRVGGDNGSLTWNYVEHEKGNLVIDPEADEAITEVVKNGVHVIFVLDYKGNWIYMDPPHKASWREARYRDVTTIYDDWPPHAHTDPEMYKAYLRWVEAMVQHFKDRVTYFEIGNEWENEYGGSHPGLEEYMEAYFLPVYEIIKRVAPDARIMLGSVTGFQSDTILACLGPPWEIGPKIDGIAWHTADAAEQEYFDEVRKLKRQCEARGFKGGFFATEIYGGFYYPPGPTPEQDEWWLNFTEIGVTKHLTRILMGHHALGIEAGVCHPHYSGFGHPQSLVRARVPAETVNACQTTATYYAWRTIATVMDDFYPAEYPVSFKSDSPLLSFTLENGDRTEWLLAAWLPTPLGGQTTPPAATDDETVEMQTDIALEDIHAKQAWGMDIMNGTEQELNITLSGNDTILEGIMIKDYPTLIRIRKSI